MRRREEGEGDGMAREDAPPPAARGGDLEEMGGGRGRVDMGRKRSRRGDVECHHCALFLSGLGERGLGWPRDI